MDFKNLLNVYEPYEVLEMYVEQALPGAHRVDGIIDIYEEIIGKNTDIVKDCLFQLKSKISDVKKQMLKKQERGDVKVQQRLGKLDTLIQDYLDWFKENNRYVDDAAEAERKAIINKKALEIIQIGKPMDYIMRVFHEDYVGGEEYGRLLILGCTCGTCNNTYGLHPSVEGESGDGKTLAMKTMANEMPPEYVIKGTISPKALFSCEVKPGSLVFLNDTGKMDEGLAQLIKTASDYYQEGTEHRSTFSGEGFHGRLPKCINWWITGVDAGSFDVQILNRNVNVNIEETNKVLKQEHKEDIFLQQMKDAVCGRQMNKITEDVLVCRAIFKHLLEQPQVNVIIPWMIDEEGELILQWNGTDNSRNFPIFLDMIKTSASIHRYQRVRDENQSIIATIDDFDEAMRIWNKVAKEQVTKYNRKDQELFQALNDLKAYEQPVTREMLCMKVRKSDKTVAEWLHGRPNDGVKGLLERAQGHLIEITQTETQFDTEIEGEDEYERKKKTGSIGRKKFYYKLDAQVDFLKLISSIIVIDRAKAKARYDQIVKDLKKGAT